MDGSSRAKVFADISAGLQSLAIIVSLVIGGYWTLRTFVFQNPTIVERGSEVAGHEPEVIKQTLSFSKLDGAKRQYAIILSISNSSKVLTQSINARIVDIAFSRPGQPVIGHAKFISAIDEDAPYRVPVSEAREIPFLVEFPTSGTYLVETDICHILNEACPVQRYIFVGDESPTIVPSSQPSSPKDRKGFKGKSVSRW